MTTHSEPVATYIRVVTDLPVPISIASLERSGEVYFINRTLTEQFGYTLGDLPNLDEFAHRALPDRAARERALAWWTRTLSDAKHHGTPVTPEEFTMIDRQGQSRQVLVHPTVIQDLVIAAYQDKTEQRSTEKALVTAEQRLREEAYMLTENIPVGTYTMVLEPGAELANFRFMSTRFLELTGLTREKAESDPLKGFACVHPHDYEAWVALNVEAFMKRKPFYGETRVVVDGTVRWISAESIPRELEDGTVVWEGVLTDLSRQKSAESALRSVHQELLQSSVRQSRLNEREALLQDMHDGFGSQLVMARRYLEQGQLTRTETIQLLDECLADLHLVADTLQVSEPNLKQALANYRHRVSQRLEATGLSVGWDVKLDSCPDHSSRELVQIMRILQESLNNVLRHAHASQVSVLIHFDSEQGLLLQVTDNGRGLDATMTHGQGIRNMQNRASELGGVLTLQNTSAGAQLQLQIPIINKPSAAEPQ